MASASDGGGADGSASASASADVDSIVPPSGTALIPGTAPSLALARSLPVPAESLATLPPMDLFVSQLSTDSSEARVDAMHRLSVVATAMGTDATLSTLVPYLANHVAMNEDEEDEILLLLADQLGNLVPGLIPGPRALPVLPLLERMAAVEETVVRDRAVASINKIVPALIGPDGTVPGPKAEGEAAAAAADGDSASAASSSTNAPALLLAMAKRLAGADWFTAKVSAAGVLPTIYRYFSDAEPAEAGEGEGGAGTSSEEAKRELRTLYKDLSEDDTPMVRRSAGKYLGKFVEAVAHLPKPAADLAGRPDLIDLSAETRAVVLDEMVPIYQALGTDEQDSVRLLAVAASGCVGCALGMDPELTGELVLPVVRGGCTDLSWRVRHNLSKEFATVTGSLGFTAPPHAAKHSEVFRFFAGLLQDQEAEVRAAAVECIAKMAQLGGPDLFQAHIAPVLPNLADDPVMEVRSKLAQAVMDCCDEEVMNTLTDRVVLQEFKPLLEGFLNDEFAEVQLRVLTKLARVSHLLAKMDAVVGSILAMAKAPNWRVRDAVGRLLPHLAEARGVSFFEDHLLEPWLKLLLDQVADVRHACVQGMPKLLSVAGPAWVQREIFPHYNRIYDEAASYLTRITILRSYAELARDGGSGGGGGGGAGHPLLEDIVAMMLRGLDDSVANVRMVAAKGLASVAACEEAIWAAKVRPALTARVTEDEDEDCKHFAQVALDACA